MTTAEHVRQLICLLERTVDTESIDIDHIWRVLELLELLVASKTPGMLLTAVERDITADPVQRRVAASLRREIDVWAITPAVLPPLLAELVAGGCRCSDANYLVLGRYCEDPHTRHIEFNLPFVGRIDRYLQTNSPGLKTVAAIALRRLDGESLESILSGATVPLAANNHLALVGVATHAEAGQLGGHKTPRTLRPQIVSTDTAEYRTIPGCPQYEISKTGTVRSKPQQLRGHNGCLRPSIELRQRNRGGILTVRMYVGGTYVTRSVAALLAAVWGECTAEQSSNSHVLT